MRLVVDRTDRLDRFLARHLPQHSRSKLARFIGAGGVTVDGRTEKPSFQVGAGSVVELNDVPEAPSHDLTPFDLALDVLYEDEDVLVVNKPRGLATHPAASLKSPSLVNALLARQTRLSTHAGSFRPGIVHRLDKETTGLLVVAKTDSAHVDLARQIAAKRAERRYFAVVAGQVERPRFVIDAPIARSRRDRLRMEVTPQGRSAITHVKLIRRISTGSILGVRLETGRTHQIRVHLRAVGLPVLGDHLYAPKEYAPGPLQLHAAYLAFRQPETGEPLDFYQPPPPDFFAGNLLSETDLDPF